MTEERVVEVKEEVGEVVGTQSIAAKSLIDATGSARQCCQVGCFIRPWSDSGPF